MSEPRPLAVLLVPGADALAFGADRAAADTRGAVVSDLAIPPLSGHPVDGRRDYFGAVARSLTEEVDRILGRDPRTRVCGVGRNHGGTLLAHAAAAGARFEALALIGAIPQLSRFRTHGEHPSAVAARRALAGRDAARELAALADLDLSTSLATLDPARCLIQAGTRDPWLDEDAHAEFRRLSARFEVQWLDDDHAMESPDAIRARWTFLGTA